MKTWWANNLTINLNIETANYQIKKGGGYNVNHPKANYIKAFLIGKNGDKKNAVKIIEDEFVSLINYKPKFNELKNEIIERIKNTDANK